jgi:hypothetical protein
VRNGSHDAKAKGRQEANIDPKCSTFILYFLKRSNVSYTVCCPWRDMHDSSTQAHTQ